MSAQPSITSTTSASIVEVEPSEESLFKLQRPPSLGKNHALKQKYDTKTGYYWFIYITYCKTLQLGGCTITPKFKINVF